MCGHTSAKKVCNVRKIVVAKLKTKKSKYVYMYIYGTKCVGRIVTKSMSYFLHLCDCSVPYCASLEAWNWFVAGQHLDASHPKFSVWPNHMSLNFQKIIFWETLNGHYYSTVREFDLIPKLRARPDYQLSSVTKYTVWLASAFPSYRNRP